jgi:hypothetical protein
VCCTGLTGVKPLSGSCQLSPAGTGLTDGAHRTDRCRSVYSRFGVPLRSQVERLSIRSLVQCHSSGYVGLAILGSESETFVRSRLHLVGVSISSEKNFYRLPFTPPLSGSPYRSFTTQGTDPQPPQEQGSGASKSRGSGS